MRVLAVFGISGVGKSWLIGRFLETHDLVHAQASALMREAKAKQLQHAVDSEQLRTGAVVDNQVLLVEAFDALRRSETRDIIFDGHNLIDTNDGFVEIPFEVIEALRPSAILVVADEPAAIAARRAADTERVRPARSIEELHDYQQRVMAIAESHAERLGIPFARIRSGELDVFASQILSATSREEDFP